MDRKESGSGRKQKKVIKELVKIFLKIKIFILKKEIGFFSERS